METEEYLASGILEMYASGGLPAHERAEVEEMLRKSPEVRAELNRIEATLEKYAQLHATTPPAALKARILDSIRAAHGTTEPALAEITPEKETPVIPMAGQFSNTVPAKETFSWLTAAAVILLLISAGLNFYFYHNWKKTEGNLQLALNQQQEIAQNFQQARFQLGQTEKNLHVLEDQNTKRVVLQGLAKSPESEAVVHWDSRTKTVLLNVKKLPAAPEGKQYQLWALKNGTPINAGLLNASEIVMGIQEMEPIAGAEAFALTLEPAGGSLNPTMEEMYLMGKM